MATSVQAIEQLPSPEREKEIRSMIEEKERQIFDLKELLPVEPGVENERVTFTVTAFIDGDDGTRAQDREWLETTLARMKFVGLVEIKNLDLARSKANSSRSSPS